MKKLLLSILLLLSTQIYSQKKSNPYTFDKVSMDVLKMNIYEKDTTANAVVIFEHGYTKVENKNGKIFLKTRVYKKIKILNSDGLKHATINIMVYNNTKNSSREKVKKIKAITHNLNEPKTYLNSKHIYTNTKSENWKEVTFTFPNAKSGSVLEYQYDLESEFFFNFNGWTFQSDIPKIQSEFHALIPGYWIYNRHLSGLIKLSTNNAEIKKDCFSLGNGYSADCEELTYIMKNIPAFIEEEKYSTTKSNYISKIKFELSEAFYADGGSKKYTTSWKETDKKLKYNESIGKQIKNTSFFLKNLPKELLVNENKLDQCKSIYKYMQKHFSLNNDKYYIYSDVNVKKAYKEKFGSVSEINLALITALKAVGIDAKILLLSTRDRGFPTKLHPVMTDFNYLVAHTTINNKTYLLDASDSYLSFDMLPFKALNSYGRVFDFKNGSYWFSITPQIDTYKKFNAELKLNENGSLSGKEKKTYTGYSAKFKRELIYNKKEEEYLNYLENKNQNLEIISYSNEGLNEPENLMVEHFEIDIKATEFIGDNMYLSPFIEKYTKNPFQLEQRNYPVNFGYKLHEIYAVTIDIPDYFTIKTIPKNFSLKLPDNGGLFIANFKKEGNKISVYTKIKLNQTIYKTKKYPYLKEFYNQIIKTQNSLITLEKTNTIETKS